MRSAPADVVGRTFNLDLVRGGELTQGRCADRGAAAAERVMAGWSHASRRAASVQRGADRQWDGHRAGGHRRGHRVARRTVRHQRARDPLPPDDRGTPDGRRVPGELVWQERRRDVALVRAPGAAMPPVRTADPSAMRPGSLVMAIGHPFGLVDAVSTGRAAVGGRATARV